MNDSQRSILINLKIKKEIYKKVYPYLIGKIIFHPAGMPAVVIKVNHSELTVKKLKLKWNFGSLN